MAYSIPGSWFRGRGGVKKSNGMLCGTSSRLKFMLLVSASPTRGLQLDFFAKSEDGLMIAKSLFGLLAQDFRINKDRWKLVADNSDSINMALLRQQQQRLALIKALAVFCKHQAILRHILKQPVIS